MFIFIKIGSIIMIGLIFEELLKFSLFNFCGIYYNIKIIHNYLLICNIFMKFTKYIYIYTLILTIEIGIKIIFRIDLI